MVVGLRNFSDRIGDGSGEPVLDTENGEEMMRVQTGVTIVLGNGTPQSPGTLYISTKRVIWLSDVDKEIGYVVGFLSISLHAISRDLDSYPSPCIYAQIEAEVGEDDDSEGSGSEANDTIDVSKITEMRLIPSDPSQLDSLFDVFCECAELNPEPNEVHEEEHNWIFSADQLDESMMPEVRDFEWQEDPGNPIGYSNGNHDVVDSILELQIDDQRFDDAEEMEREAQSGHQ
ncbi:Chloride conductance regulatory protein icln [Thalictrum thalictroides]|uniref:Chloride conductance regulatory protein icln n=1 Tax=Thalictrum thalictroides TaxID=46969 RepID=A0A7J6WA75_THATH|nr:Chloride conductance regulatory protein icln [Thalictrum thalictroides]